MTTHVIPQLGKSYQTAVERWAGVGPYYAMFPNQMAFDVVRRYTKPGDRVLDPFVGRGSSIYAAGALGRVGYGIEINPVGWVYSMTKLRPATESRVRSRLRALALEAKEVQPAPMPEFFYWAYCPDVLRFLLTARRCLRWRDSSVDRTLMAFILVYLHGKRGYSLSNQLRDSKAMAPQYAVRWWQQRAMEAPEVDPIQLLEKRITWRYRKGRTELAGHVALGDSLKILASKRRRRGLDAPFDLLFTSPPYRGITNYHTDQWLRLWMLGRPPSPARIGDRWQRKFEARGDYRHLLTGVFKAAARRLKPDGVVFVRTDAREFTLEATLEALRKAFPKRKAEQFLRPAPSKSQTALFGDSTVKPGEVDVLLLP